MPKRALALSKVYALLEPGPVVLLATAHRGRRDVMCMSWHTMLEFEPPLVGCVVSNRHLSFGLLKKSGECTVNIPTAEIGQQAISCGNTSGEKIDKFARFDLTPVAGKVVAAPLVDECYANLECRIADRRMVNAYCFFVLEVVKAWIDPAVREPRTLHHRGHGRFSVAGETIRLRSKAR